LAPLHAVGPRWLTHNHTFDIFGGGKSKFLSFIRSKLIQRFPNEAGFIMSNPFVIASATINRNYQIAAFVDMSRINDGEGNAAIILLKDGDMLPLFALGEQVLDICLSDEPESLYVLTHRKLLRYSSFEEDSQADEIVNGNEEMLFKKMFISNHYIYLFTMQDEILRVDPDTNQVSKLECDLDESDGLESMLLVANEPKYAVGMNGLFLSYDGSKFVEHTMPTNKHLAAMDITESGELVIVGQAGLILKGAMESIEVIDHDWVGYDIWDVTVYQERIFILLEIGVFELSPDNEVIPVISREQVRSIFFSFERFEEILWAVSERNILEYDGNDWKDVISLSAE
jgi:hypothetical protein